MLPVERGVVCHEIGNLHNTANRHQLIFYGRFQASDRREIVFELSSSIAQRSVEHLIRDKLSQQISTKSLFRSSGRYPSVTPTSLQSYQ